MTLPDLDVLAADARERWASETELWNSNAGRYIPKAWWRERTQTGKGMWAQYTRGCHFIQWLWPLGIEDAICFAATTTHTLIRVAHRPSEEAERILREWRASFTGPACEEGKDGGE